MTKPPLSPDDDGRAPVAGDSITAAKIVNSPVRSTRLPEVAPCPSCLARINPATGECRCS